MSYGKRLLEILIRAFYKKRLLEVSINSSTQHFLMSYNSFLVERNEKTGKFYLGTARNVSKSIFRAESAALEMAEITLKCCST